MSSEENRVSRVDDRESLYHSITSMQGICLDSDELNQSIPAKVQTSCSTLENNIQEEGELNSLCDTEESGRLGYRSRTTGSTERKGREQEQKHGRLHLSR